MFALYSVASGGVAIWSETQSLTFTDGVFSAYLGAVTSLPGSVDFNTDNLFLGINVNSDGEMTPRVRLAAVPQAFNAEKVSGLTVTNTTGTLTIPNSRTVSFGHNFTTSGANPLTFTTTGTTNATIPLGTVTLADLASSQTFTNKTWQGNTVGAIYGGTGQTSYATGDLIYASATNVLAKRAIGSTGQCLVVAGGVPVWGSCGSATLQSAYDLGPTVNVAATDIQFDLTLDGGIDTNFIVTIAGGSAGQFRVSTTAGQFYVEQGSVTSTMPLTVSAAASISGTLTLAGSPSIATASGNLTLQPAGTGTAANVQIGAGGAGSATPDLLVVDAKSTTGDPTAVDGAIYYNKNSRKFRCAQDGVWFDCISYPVVSSAERDAESWMPLNNTATALSTLYGGTITASGTGAANATTDGMFVSYTTAAVINSAAGVEGNTSGRFRADWRPRMSMILRTGASIANQRIWAGFSNSATTTDVPTLASRQVGFRYSTTAGDTTWRCFSTDSVGVSAASDTGITVTANTTYILDLDWSVSGTLVCRARTLTGNPGTVTVTTNLDNAGTTELRPRIRMTNTTAAATVFSIGNVAFDYR